MLKQPSPEKVKELRTQVQWSKGLAITAAQDRCAKALHVPRRTWQKLEAGERKMHLAFWDLARRKLR